MGSGQQQTRDNSGRYKLPVDASMTMADTVQTTALLPGASRSDPRPGGLLGGWYRPGDAVFRDAVSDGPPLSWSCSFVARAQSPSAMAPSRRADGAARAASSAAKNLAAVPGSLAPAASPGPPGALRVLLPADLRHRVQAVAPGSLQGRSPYGGRWARGGLGGHRRLLSGLAAGRSTAAAGPRSGRPG